MQSSVWRHHLLWFSTPLLLAHPAAGCLQSETTRCTFGKICPPDFECHEQTNTCVKPEHISACQGLGDGDRCELSDAPGANNFCEDGICIVGDVCGNDSIGLGEDCELTDLDGATCQSLGYDHGELSCGADCKFDVRHCHTCGNLLCELEEDHDSCPQDCEIATLSVGSIHACARIGTKVFCWGSADSGQLGDGRSDHPRCGFDPLLQCSFVPSKVVDLTDAVGLTTGEAHTCALRAGGTVACWGENGADQLGGQPENESFVPLPIETLEGVVSLSAGVGFLGGDHTCVVNSDATVACWGLNSQGQAGAPLEQFSVSSPRRVFELEATHAVSAGGRHTCVLLADATVRCFGDNACGQLGDGQAADTSTPVAVADLSNVAAVAAGGNFTCALDTDGVVSCWGENSLGQLGRREATFDECTECTCFSSGCNQYACSRTPQTVPGLFDVVALAAGGDHACAILADATLRCWGFNKYGQLGDGTTTSPNEPVTVDLPGAAQHVACGSSSTCAVNDEEEVYCWGSNDFGQLGSGDDLTRHSPNLVQWD